MPLRLDSQSADFAERFRAFLGVKREAAQDVEQTRARHHRRREGARRPRAVAADAQIRPARSRQGRHARDARRRSTRRRNPASREALAALKLARDRIEAYHLRQKPSDERFTDALGVEMGSRWTAIEAVGLYVPGGTAAYPSSVLMNAVPAKVAGCARLVMVVPAPDGKLVAVGAGGGQARRRRRDLSHRRRAGDGRARLWHRDDRAGRQDRRPRQCLCGGGQAPGVRPGRHRHDRRARPRC